MSKNNLKELTLADFSTHCLSKTTAFFDISRMFYKCKGNTFFWKNQIFYVKKPLYKLFCRDDRIRTCDLMLPKHAYYQLYYIPFSKNSSSFLISFAKVSQNFETTKFFINFFH